MNIIDVKNFSFKLQNKEILKNISFEIAEKSIISLLGPNGSGKSTLFKCLINIYKAEEGTIKIADLDSKNLKQRELAKFLGYIPQLNKTILPFTVSEFLLMCRTPYLNLFYNKSDYEQVEHALTKIDIKELYFRKLETLSGGEMQKVFIAGLLVQNTRIMLLDEPISALDPKHQDEILKLLKELNQKSSVTIFMITHDINHALLISDGIIALKNGELLFSGTPEQFISRNICEALYDKPFRFIEHPEGGKQIILPDLL